MEKWKKALLKISQSGRTDIIYIIEKILLKDFSDLDIKKMKGSDFYRCRYGSYRIIFSLENTIVKIIKVGSRGDVYNDL